MRGFHPRKMMFKYCKLITAVALVSASAAAQTTYTVQPVMVSAAAGPGSAFSISLALSPVDTGVQVTGMDVTVGYDSDKATLVSVEDNTNQPHAAVEYSNTSAPAPSGVVYADTFRHLQMSTAANLISPSNLARLNFQTTASFSPSDEISIYLNKWPLDGPSSGLYNENFSSIPAAYLSLEPSSSVQNWTLY